MPNWCLRKGSLGLKQVLERGSRETFSFLSTGSASPSFSVGQTAIVLCWDTKANTSILLLSPTCANGLHSVPAFNWVTLQFVYNDWDSTVEVSASYYLALCTMRRWLHLGVILEFLSWSLSLSLSLSLSHNDFNDGS